MKLRLKAELLDKFVGDGEILIDVREVREVFLDLRSEGARMVDAETGDGRDLNRDEERDLEDALEMVRMRAMGRALAKLVRPL